jgi:hypothetical protein
LIVGDGIVLYDFGIKAGKILFSSKTTLGTGNDPVPVPPSLLEKAPPFPGSSVPLATAVNSPSKALTVTGKVIKVLFMCFWILYRNLCSQAIYFAICTYLTIWRGLIFAIFESHIDLS